MQVLQDYQDRLIEKDFDFAPEESPRRAAFALACAEHGLVSEARLDALVQRQTQAALEKAIDEAIRTFGASVRIRKNGFTKSAQRHLRASLSSKAPLALAPALTAEIIEQALNADLLNPSDVVSAVNNGERGVRALTGAVFEALNTRLPSYLSFALSDEGFVLYANDMASLALRLPYDASPESQALRMAVLNALTAISVGISEFTDPTSAYSIGGRVMYALDEAWSFFRPLIQGKSRDEIAALLTEADSSTWSFEPYWFGADDAADIQEDEEMLERLIDTLDDIARYESKYAIADMGYYNEFDATCAAQIAFIAGQRTTYAQHAPIYDAVLEALTVARQFHAADRHVTALCKSEQIVTEMSALDEGMTLMDAVLVQVREPLPQLDELLEQHLSDTFNNVGLPQLTIRAEQGAFGDLILPLIDAATQAHRLITQINDALENDHARHAH